ncbi:homocysteine S-methyltransferase family protein [Vibrio maerlii]|uniref:homocysteine S-methyltransferase family protein n=1 Tax=Vibrio maerlii TaxID=2231648 RepID=UPI000E3E5FF5|nr:homocysteine S-methyltransferase family protein [Vibrio maerlii]
MTELVIMDGGMGRELERVGAPFSQPLWSAQALIESPQHVLQAHENFIHSGAELIITNSYACVPFHLGRDLYQSRGTELASLSGKLAKQAKLNMNTSVNVSGSLPPPFGSYRPDLFLPDEAESIYTELMKAQEPYVDSWIVETLSSVVEFEIAHKVLNSSDKPRYYAFTLSDKLNEQPTLRSGESVRQAITKACELGADAVLFNCSVPEVMEQALADSNEIMNRCSVSMTLGAYANSFSAIQSDHEANDTLQAMRPLSPLEYLAFAQRWYEAGARIIGGCCGIGPEHIEELAKWKSNLSQ